MRVLSIHKSLKPTHNMPNIQIQSLCILKWQIFIMALALRILAYPRPMTYRFESKAKHILFRMDGHLDEPS